MEGDRPLRERARLGHGARGLQRRRQGLGVLPVRARPLARLPLERGRTRRDLRPRTAHVLRARLLEWARPVPEGAHLRSHRPRGQSRRGRQGVLVVRRRDADRLVAAAGATTIRRPSSRTLACARRTRGAARTIASSSSPTPASSTATATGRSPPTTRRRRRATSACASASAMRDPRPPSCTCCRRCGSATAGPGRKASRGPRSVRRRIRRPAQRARSPRRRTSAAGGSPRAPIRPAARRSCSSARTRPTSALLFGGARADAVPQGRHQRPRRRRRGHGQSRAARHEDGVLVPRRRRRRRDRRAAAASRARRFGQRARPRRRLRSHARRPRARGRRVLRDAAAAGRQRRRGRRDAAGVRRNGLEPAVLSLRRRALARRRSDAAAAARGAQVRAQRRLAAPQQPRHHRDARQVGVPLVRRVGPRVPLRGARAHRPGGGEAPAAAPVPRVVHAPERPAARPTSGTSAT